VAGLRALLTKMALYDSSSAMPHRALGSSNVWFPASITGIAGRVLLISFSGFLGCVGGFVARAPAATRNPHYASAEVQSGTQTRKRKGAPRCFGAAARDPEHPCDNPSLALTVVPTPSEAVIIPNAPCTPVEEADELLVCAFGIPSAQATGTVALVGDSHAGHWRAALEVAAQALGLQGLSITRPGCPFTLAHSSLSEPRGYQCRRWVQDVIQWFPNHPEVSTVFVSEDHRATSVPGGHGMFGRQAAGYMGAWNALPASVKHIVVIRDDPGVRGDTLACVQRAINKHLRPGLVCAVPRRSALGRDPAAVAAAHGSSRVQALDMTPFFCDNRLCDPVVGGALVYKDVGHLTRVFATTLGPFVLRDIDRLRASWELAGASAVL
jgi:hypothetical protein